MRLILDNTVINQRRRAFPIKTRNETPRNGLDRFLSRRFLSLSILNIPIRSLAFSFRVQPRDPRDVIACFCRDIARNDLLSSLCSTFQPTISAQFRVRRIFRPLCAFEQRASQPDARPSGRARFDQQIGTNLREGRATADLGSIMDRCQLGAGRGPIVM